MRCCSMDTARGSSVASVVDAADSPPPSSLSKRCMPCVKYLGMEASGMPAAPWPPAASVPMSSARDNVRTVFAVPATATAPCCAACAPPPPRAASIPATWRVMRACAASKSRRRRMWPFVPMCRVTASLDAFTMPDSELAL